MANVRQVSQYETRVFRMLDTSIDKGQYTVVAPGCIVPVLRFS